ncbi:phosphatidylinositol N-acetylglucosaminyltransferase [Martiniozyma asiatica (nom. inval.)]|nr:phosphatidylinositol N-acetylglucosaminyltransferase [Martiniozyma asiatica]
MSLNISISSPTLSSLLPSLIRSESGILLGENSVSDELARDSDVTVSTTITPQAEYKGFASHVLFCFAVILWLCWCFLPDALLNRLGIDYYPSKWWALAVPAYVLVLMVYGYVALWSYNRESLTLPLDDIRNFVDDSGVVLTSVKKLKHTELDEYCFKPTNGVWDLPIVTVNNVLYGNNGAF